jgi:hypothetical protein
MEADMDFLFGLGQVICISGLLYGAYLSITYVDHEETPLEAKPQAGRAWTTARPSLRDRCTAGDGQEKRAVYPFFPARRP